VDKIGIIFTSCPKSVATVVLSYMKALKLWRFDNVLVDFWPHFTAHAQNGHILAFGYNSDNRMEFDVRVKNFDDKKASWPFSAIFLCACA